MANIFSSGAAEEAPSISDGRECWYIPIFGVTHPKKPGKVRAVFDSSLVYQGCSLNDVLLSGPNLTNSLLGILLRFRKDRYAIAGDIQQMFYRFFVNDDHRDFLRFYWYQNNDPNLPLVEYRMTVHVFGNRPSPAVATYGLRRAVQGADLDVVQFVQRDFYVDDALTSRPSASETIDLMKRTQAVLASEGNIRLHKIVSNDKQVMDAFSAADLGKDMKDLSVGDDSMLLQHSLGLAWDLRSDSFVFTSPDSVVPFTRRGILSKVNSIFDPVGFLSPVTICGKMLLREMCPTGTDWDEPLSESFRDPWMKWTQSLDELSSVRIPRMFVPESLSSIQNPEFLVFSDASEKAIAAAAYVKVNDHIGFVMGKSKLAPISGHSIPRLELCGAVLATEIGEFVSDHLSIPSSAIRYFTDSKVVLGYIRNRTRRFYTYVSNRVSRIHSVSKPDQWNYVPSNLNPSDSATRGFIAEVTNTLDTWLKGPLYLRRGDPNLFSEEEDFPLVNPDEDAEVRPEPTVLKGEVTTSAMPTPIVDRFSRFSTWNGLVSGVSTLRHIAGSYCGSTDCSGWHMCKLTRMASFRRDTEHHILRHVQDQAFSRELDALKGGTSLPRDSRIGSLSPYLDEAGLLRVGGRLNRLQNTLGLASTNPVIVPKGHVATLLVRHYHERVFHQGRTITEGSLRSNGFWVLGAKKAIQSLIHRCVFCKKLRGSVEEQKMANLPDDRLTPGPPFSSVGVDVFGPWQVITRRTRGGAAHSKRWAVLFTCLTTRAIHIEVIEEMSSSCFINALRRFTALRGPVTILRSDRGTNFVGCTDQLKIDAINVEDDKVQPHLYNSGTVWKFNPPHSSHMGGVWERMIGVTRRILDGMLLEQNKKGLTHEVLCTLMAEVCAVVNSRPITAISTDPESPVILSPNILLTQKQGQVPPVSGELTLKDTYSANWKHVQVLSDMFWTKWQREYLQQLQSRCKWRSERPNVKEGDIVLMKEKNLPRNEWPIGIVTEAIRSHDDDLVRKAVIRLNRDGKCVSYTRPISELVLLVDD